jgi:hypothetical protein
LVGRSGCHSLLFCDYSARGRRVRLIMGENIAGVKSCKKLWGFNLRTSLAAAIG